MQPFIRASLFVLAFLVPTIPVIGQERSGLMGDLAAIVTGLERKVVGLAKAIPESAYDWRPGEGVRSVSDVLMHVAGENYFAAAKMGTPPPVDTGIVGHTIKEARAYEERRMTRVQVITALEQSFVLLRKSMADTPDDRLETTIAFFGPNRKDTVRRAWVATTTHLHEHLGQLIAYARSNKVVPPWNR
jgi:uncharacterized damage-inducible protein DinB